MTTSDSPQPPGSPMRRDEPDTDESPAQVQSEEDRELQEENAETSLDQPST